MNIESNNKSLDASEAFVWLVLNFNLLRSSSPQFRHTPRSDYNAFRLVYIKDTSKLTLVGETKVLRYKNSYRTAVTGLVRLYIPFAIINYY